MGQATAVVEARDSNNAGLRDYRIYLIQSPFQRQKIHRNPQVFPDKNSISIRFSGIACPVLSLFVLRSASVFVLTPEPPSLAFSAGNANEKNSPCRRSQPCPHSSLAAFPVPSP